MTREQFITELPARINAISKRYDTNSPVGRKQSQKDFEALKIELGTKELQWTDSFNPGRAYDHNFPPK